MHDGYYELMLTHTALYLRWYAHMCIDEYIDVMRLRQPMATPHTHTETPTICLERVLLCVKKHFNRSYIENAKPYLLPHAYVYVKHSNMLIIRCLMNAYTAFGQYMKKKESSSALRQLIFCHNTSSHRTDFHPLDEACLWLYCGGGCRWCCNCGCDVHGR